MNGRFLPTLSIAILVAGVAMDIAVWLLRWRPYWVWFNKKRTTMGNAPPEITVGGVANYIIIGKKYGAI